MNIKRITLSLLFIILSGFLLISCTRSSDGGLDPSVPVGTEISVTYKSYSDIQGKVEGVLDQVISYGETATLRVSAIPSTGYKFAYWSDGVTSAVRENESPAQSGEIIAYFELDKKELPILYITTENGAEIDSKETYINGQLSVYNAGEKHEFSDLDMQIRGRGNYTWDSTFNPRDPMYNKRPYRMKLSEQKDLCGVGEGKSRDWVLLADHCDQSLLRNNIVYTFASSMPGIYWQPDVQSVEVYLNGEYNGVYLLCEQVEVNKNKINLSEDLSSAEVDFLVMYSNYADPWSMEGFEVFGRPYEIKSDLSENTELAYQQKEYIYEYIEQCYIALIEGDKETVCSLIDIDSLIDTYIVHELFKNLDTGHDNFYMYRELGGKLVIGPVWDFDQCAGNANEGVDDPTGIRGGMTQPWYSLLLERTWFKKMVVEKWSSMKGAIDQIPKLITDTAEGSINSYRRNFEKWQIFGYKINRETYVREFTTYEEHYKYFAEFMVDRTKWLDAYLNDPTFTLDSGSIFEGDGTKKSPYLINDAQSFYLFTQALLSGETFESRVFLQTADIDMRGFENYRGMGASATFAGTYNGNGYSITVDLKGNDECIFPYVTGLIMNVTTKGSIENTGNAGGIARSVRSRGLIVNCASYISFIGGSNVGGIVSSNQTDAFIINCFFGGTIEGASTAAPICVWYERREGTYLYNLYVEGTPNDTEYVTLERDEEAIKKDYPDRALRSLNDRLSNVDYYLAFEFGEVYTDKICSWEYENGVIRLIPCN